MSGPGSQDAGAARVRNGFSNNNCTVYKLKKKSLYLTKLLIKLINYYIAQQIFQVCLKIKCTDSEEHQHYIYVFDINIYIIFIGKMHLNNITKISIQSLKYYIYFLYYCKY